MRMISEQEAKKLVAEAGRMLLDEGLVARTWGNVSCRTGAAGYVITPSGLGYDRIREEDVVAYDMQSGVSTGRRAPSSEKGVHTRAYERFCEARFVIHTHQTYASALGLAGFEALLARDANQAALGGVALARYGLPGTKELTDHVAAAMEDGAHTVLMAHHGALIVGASRAEAFMRARRLEECCRAVCKGQPESGESDAPSARDILDALRTEFGCAAQSASPAVLEIARLGMPIRAELDDMAQMIGETLPVAAPERAVAALKDGAAVLVPGIGALVRADSGADAKALLQLVQKACVCRLHTRACNTDARLSGHDAQLMRRSYVESYSKLIGG